MASSIPVYKFVDGSSRTVVLFDSETKLCDVVNFFERISQREIRLVAMIADELESNLWGSQQAQVAAEVSEAQVGESLSETAPLAAATSRRRAGPPPTNKVLDVLKSAMKLARIDVAAAPNQKSIEDRALMNLFTENDENAAENVEVKASSSVRLGRPTISADVLERDSICSECNATFFNKHNLDRHHKRIHLREKKFACSTCQKPFFRKDELRRHEKRKCCPRKS